MSAVPSEVRIAFMKLKKKYEFYIALANIQGKFYVYRRSSRWDKKEKKIRSVSEYLGKINADGTFVEKQPKIEKNQNNPERTPEDNKSKFSESDSKILTILSTNARADLAHWGRILGLGNNIYSHVRRIEQKYAISYITEIDVEKLGYLKFFVFVKFLDRLPKANEIKSALIKEPRVQFAAYMKGEYDLIVYILAKNNEEAIDTVIALRETTLAHYPSEWYTMPFYEHFGFIPLRDEFIDVLKNNLLEREYAVLRSVNKNASMRFVDIDKQYGFDAGRSDYTYHTLEKMGIVKRATITMGKIPSKYVGLIFMRILREDDFKKNRKSFLLNIIEEQDSALNKFILSGDIGMPDGTMFLMPIFKEGDLEKTEENMAKLSVGVRLRSYVLTEIILGLLCYRKLDVTNSRQYDILANTYNIKFREKADYKGTGKASKTDGIKGKVDIRGIKTKD